MLDVDGLSRLVKNDAIDTVIVAFTDVYGRFLGKRHDAGFFLDSVVKDGSHACDYLLTVDMELDPVPGYDFANWSRGYGDLHLVPDLETLRICSWLDKTAMVQCDLYDSKTHAEVAISPRALLRRQVNVAKDLGFAIMAASELEYFLYKDSYERCAQKDYNRLEAAGWYREDYLMLQSTRNEYFHGAARRHLKSSGIPVETSKGETGVGQHELNIRYAEVLKMADRHAVYKQALKEMADSMKLAVTFMAKPHHDQAGSGCHLHLSLWRDGRNAFAGTHRVGGLEVSDEFLWFLGGWMEHAPAMMAMYAPTVNSYKRFRAGSWAPTACAWSHDNRTTGFRVVGAGPSLRIECRLPGADVNPYLAFAASLASGLDGIRNKTQPPPMLSGDAYKAGNVPLLPSNLAQAAALFAGKSANGRCLAKEAFGEAAWQHYTHFWQSEQAAWESAVTDWERRRYFEQI